MPDTSAYVIDVEFMLTGDLLVYHAMYDIGYSDSDDGFYLYDFAWSPYGERIFFGSTPCGDDNQRGDFETLDIK